MDKYTLFYKQQLTGAQLAAGPPYDVFLSAYTKADRVRHVYDSVSARKKIWMVFPHFEFDIAELPPEERCIHLAREEHEFVHELLLHLPENLSALKFCIDVTGFIRPHLMFLVKWLSEKGVKRFDTIYAEPRQYREREQTEFSLEIIDEVRQVAGFEGDHIPDTSNDVLIIGVGYQDHLISQVAQNKAKAHKLQMFGYPPLRADMYQENVLKVHLASESLGAGRVNDVDCSLFAPAADPFVTASALSEKVKDMHRRKPITNLYLCPLATKAQVLGFTLYFLTECTTKSASIIFPFEAQYHKSTSVHVERIWRYTIELPNQSG